MPEKSPKPCCQEYLLPLLARIDLLEKQLAWETQLREQEYN
jgi:hypothetical protein